MIFPKIMINNNNNNRNNNNSVNQRRGLALEDTYQGAPVHHSGQRKHKNQSVLFRRICSQSRKIGIGTCLALRVWPASCILHSTSECHAFGYIAPEPRATLRHEKSMRVWLKWIILLHITRNLRRIINCVALRNHVQASPLAILRFGISFIVFWLKRIFHAAWHFTG